MADSLPRQVSFQVALAPILALLSLILYGLILRPQWYGQDAFPLEVIFITGASLAIAYLFALGIQWKEIEQSIVDKLQRALPAFFILFTIGMLIGSWLVCGTIPMMVYWGLQLISPSLFYLLAFLIPVVFSLLTGTSWGSVGAIGIVIMGICGALGADPGITAGAVIGGAFFGDKMSPLSDTTNLAALAAEVDLFDHIRSMMYSTVPSAILAATVYTIVGFLWPPDTQSISSEANQEFVDTLQQMFHFHWLLLLPPIFVLYRSFRGKPTLPTLILATAMGVVLALSFQSYSLDNIMVSLKSGFTVDMATWVPDPPDTVRTLLDRGGLYSLSEAVVIAFTVFVFIGALDCIDAIPTVVRHLFGFTDSSRATVLATLAATALTNSLTSNQYATSFIVGDAFKSKFDALGIPRKVLSRSLEDTGTMLESLVFWTPSAVYMVKTLGVPFQDYWYWQLLSLFNFVVAIVLALTGWGCFYEEPESYSAPDGKLGPFERDRKGRTEESESG